MISDFKYYFYKIFTLYLPFIFSTFLFIFVGSFDLHPFPYNFLTRSQNDVSWFVCAEELKIVCFRMFTFIFRVVPLIFFVLAGEESKKMWSKFDNVTPAWGKGTLSQVFSLDLREFFQGSLKWKLYWKKTATLFRWRHSFLSKPRIAPDLFLRRHCFVFNYRYPPKTLKAWEIS